MDERAQDAPLPRAHPAPGAPGPVPDGDTVPQPPAPPSLPPTTRELVIAWATIGVAIAAAIIGITRGGATDE